MPDRVSRIGFLSSATLLVCALIAMLAPPASAAVSPEFVERDPVDVISDASAVAESPDGKNIYATARDGDSIVVIERDVGTGALSFVEAAAGPDWDTPGGCGARNLTRPTDVAVSPDGSFVYATGYRSVFVFARDSFDGGLTFVEHELDACPGSSPTPLYLGSGGAGAVAIAPDGAHVYVSSSTDQAITVFNRSATTGLLAMSHEYVRDLPNPGDLASLQNISDISISPDGSHLYATSNTDGPITAFKRTPATGELAEIQVLPEGGLIFDDRRSTVTVAPGGANVYVSQSNDREIQVYERETNSGLGSFGKLSLVEEESTSPDRVSRMSVSPDGQDLYASAGDSIHSYERDTGANGELDLSGTSTSGGAGVDGLIGASGVLVSGDGENVYGISSADDAVSWFDRAAGTGLLSFVDSSAAEAPNFATDVAASPDGRNVYATGRISRSVSVYGLAADGTMSLLEREIDNFDDPGDAGGTAQGLDLANAVEVSPDGLHVYVGGAEAGILDAIAIFDRDPATGRLSFQEVVVNGSDGVNGLSGVNDLATTADGEHLYATATITNSLVAFRREADGGLTYVEHESDGNAGVQDLGLPRALAISGNSIYVAADADDAVSVFSRNPATGAIGLVEAIDAADAGNTMFAPQSVAVSADGASVYVGATQTGSGLGSVAAFSRNPGSGALTFAEAELQTVDDPSDPGGGVDGLRTVSDIVATADGASVVAVSSLIGQPAPGGPVPFGDAMTIFDRDATTSKLSYASAHYDGRQGVDGLEDPTGVVERPGGTDLYVSALGDDSVALFGNAPDPPDPPSPPGPRWHPGRP